MAKLIEAQTTVAAGQTTPLTGAHHTFSGHRHRGGHRHRADPVQ
jgi:hypothetical protein